MQVIMRAYPLFNMRFKLTAANSASAYILRTTNVSAASLARERLATSSFNMNLQSASFP